MPKSIKCVSIYTCEVDEPEAALAELTQQLSEKITLAANTVGIIQCHPEFITSGVLSHVAANLPFDVAGTTTSSQSVNGLVNEMALTIFVITADDISFYVGRTDCARSGISKPLSAALENVEKNPNFIFTFPPLVIDYPGDDHVEAWGKEMPGVPVFGTMPVDDSIEFEDVRTIYRDEVYQTSMVFVLCYGNIKPRFLISTLPEDSTLPYKGEITKSEGNLVYEIDNGNAIEYMKNMGFVDEDTSLSVYWFVPFLIDQKERPDYDGVPILRGFAVISEDGKAGRFRGKVDQGSVFTMLNMTNEGVLIASGKKAEEISQMTDVNGVIGFSCIVRRMALMNTDSCDELTLVSEKLGDIPFMMCYAGGEICPTSVNNNVAINRYHSFSLIFLVL